jgi:hypothetical protein
MYVIYEFDAQWGWCLYAHSMSPRETLDHIRFLRGIGKKVRARKEI